MRRMLTASLFALAGLALSAASASAQIVSPFARPGYRPASRPQLSPYLNLLRGGNPAANYYLGVIPEQERRQNTQQFRSELQRVEEEQRNLELAPQDQDLVGRKLQSGHLTTTNTTLGYYGDLRGYYGQQATGLPRVPLTTRTRRGGQR